MIDDEVKAFLEDPAYYETYHGIAAVADIVAYLAEEIGRLKQKISLMQDIAIRHIGGEGT